MIIAHDGLPLPCPCPCSGLYELSSYRTTKTTTRILYILTFGVPNIYLNELPTSPFLLQFFSATDQFSVCIRKRNRFTRVAQQEIYLLIHVFSFSFRDEVKLKQALQWRHCLQQRRWQLLLVFCKAALFQIVKTHCQQNKKGWLGWALMFGRKRYAMLTINLIPPD